MKQIVQVVVEKVDWSVKAMLEVDLGVLWVMHIIAAKMGGQIVIVVMEVDIKMDQYVEIDVINDG